MSARVTAGKLQKFLWAFVDQASEHWAAYEKAVTEVISQKVLIKSFCKSQFPREFVNLFFILVIIKDNLTDLWGG